MQAVGEAGEQRPPNAAIAWAMRIERTLDVVLGLMLLAVALILFYQVFGRYVIGRAPAWTEEISRMLVAWIAMLGTGACLRTGGHVAVGALVNAVPPRVRVVLLALRDVVVMATAGVLGWRAVCHAQCRAGLCGDGDPHGDPVFGHGRGRGVVGAGFGARAAGRSNAGCRFDLAGGVIPR
jgi:hypothetical protein